jgi:hypothetical protein
MPQVSSFILTSMGIQRKLSTKSCSNWKKAEFIIDLIKTRVKIKAIAFPET